ncbi:MAG: HAMP domain-containing histidine kinase [Oscillospiraceae bacterium]|jgi:signal transduction histidine kinase|nr:HAMP domain-containing histidine kinase [Oscillospiraceae bacterium]
MKKLYLSLPAKVTAIFLVCILAALCMASGLMVAYMAYEGYYAADSKDYYDTYSFDSITFSYANTAYEYYTENIPAAGIQDYFGPDKTNFAYEIVPADEPDTVLASNYIQEEPYRTMRIQTDNHIVNCFVRDPITIQDRYYETYRVFEQAYPLRFTAIAVLIPSAVLFLALLIFLLCGAGRRRDSDDITLNIQDRLPIDLYLATAATLIVLLLYVPLDNMIMRSVFEWVVMGVFALAAFCVALAALMTLATRFKAGLWWRNSIIWRLARLAVKIVRAVGRVAVLLLRATPVIWKAALGFCAVTLINFMFAYMFFVNYSNMALVLGFIFNWLLFLGVCLTARNMHQLKKAGMRLAAGDLEYKVDTRWLFMDFLDHAQNLSSIREGMSAAIEERLKSERLKTELITNVSHDIKTPLTSIINYVDLLQKEDLPPTATEYTQILDRQAIKLKKLTDDLVEASKASTGNLAVTLKKTGVHELVDQSVGEYTARFDENNLEAVVSAPEDEAFILADGKFLWRVMDNLFDNACKYSQPGTRVYIEVAREKSDVAIRIKNISRDKLNLAPDELMERFVRGDSARATQGSGLGLSIARSLTELQNGRFGIVIDGDLFKTELVFAEIK